MSIVVNSHCHCCATVSCLLLSLLIVDVVMTRCECETRSDDRASEININTHFSQFSHFFFFSSQHRYHRYVLILFMRSLTILIIAAMSAQVVIANVVSLQTSNWVLTDLIWLIACNDVVCEIHRLTRVMYKFEKTLVVRSSR